MPRFKHPGSHCCVHSCRSLKHSKPRLRPALAEGELLEIGSDLEPSQLDGRHLPAGSEAFFQFLPRPPPWALASRFRVAETHQEDSSARLDYGRQPCDVAPPVLVREEDVEEATVDHVVEPFAPVLECKG